MGRKQTDQDWEQWGKSNPYFGVISDPKFLGSSLTTEVKQEFFNSGKSHADELFRVIDSLLGQNFKPESSLDFGCGVGRITQALAAHTDSVLGVDVSLSMLKEAEVNLPTGLKSKVTFKDAEEELRSGKQYDLVHSYIVLQHIPKAEGYKITRQLLTKISPGGVAALHYTFAAHVPRSERAIQLMRYHLPPLHQGLNIARGKAARTPMMHIYDYNLNKLLLIYQEFKMLDLKLQITRHGEYSGVFIIAQKPDLG